MKTKKKYVVVSLGNDFKFVAGKFTIAKYDAKFKQLTAKN